MAWDIGKKIPAWLCAAVICLWLYRACLGLSLNMKVEGKYEPQLQWESFSSLSESAHPIKINHETEP